MDYSSLTMSAMTMESMSVPNYYSFSDSEPSLDYSSLDYGTITSNEINNLIEWDINSSPMNAEESFLTSNVDPMLSDCIDNADDVINAYMDLNKGLFSADPMDNIENLICIQPAIVFSARFMQQEPHSPPKFCNPTWLHDHDYTNKTEEDEKNAILNTEAVGKTSDAEAIVEVWEIEKFAKKSPASPQPSSSHHQKPKEPRRKSTRNAESNRQKEQALKIAAEQQARRISNAMKAVLKQKPQRRQYKNIKPKNSVETTPSQSDIEEWSSQSIRPTYTKITRKKTSKGRIDHSESERHRREVLRRHFSSLCDLIPNEYLRGEKASSQISKQKILNGAKAYILAVYSRKSSYKALYNRNFLLREKFHKKIGKVLKCVKKQK